MLLAALFVTVIKDTISYLLSRDNSRHLEIKNPRTNYEQIRSVYTLCCVSMTFISLYRMRF